MSVSKRLWGVAVAALIALDFGGAAAQQAAPAASNYDYYVLSLSWAPAYCARAGAKADPKECGPNAYPGFVLHGLWPQREQGGWPENCPNIAQVPPTVVDALLEVMPSPDLVRHEWTKHGSCTGLTPDDYFAETRAAWERVRLPEALVDPNGPISVPADEVKTAIVQVGDVFELKPEDVAMICDGKGVTEIRFCLDKDLNFRACGKGVADTCRKDEALTRK